jgi:ATP-dependent Clp protease ATP-binding subunit ClpB
MAEEKQKSEDLTQIKKDIESQIRSRKSFRAGDYAKVAEIQYGKLRERRRVEKN